jgi:site-specific DNA recombinase
VPKKQAVSAAAIYCRISLDKAGEGLGVKRQQELCEKLAAEKGWFVGEVYVDNDKSAYGKRPRPEYERMLADLEAGRRDAVLCVDLDRLTRRPSELERFMELADARGIALANVSGDTDLSSSDGRFKARIMGAVARQESEKKAERVSREAEQAARSGKPRASRRPFGYEMDLVTLREDEAELIREAVKRVLAGETVPRVCVDWNERGIASPQGAKHGWAATSLVNVLRSGRIAGLRTYKGEVVAEGSWPEIIDRETFERLQAKIKRTRRNGRPTHHLLVGILRCGYCGCLLWTSWHNPCKKDSEGKRHRERERRAPRYACVKRPGHPGCGRCTVRTEPLDELVIDAVIERVSGRRLAAALRRVGKDEEGKASAELTAAEARLEELAADYAAGEISRREWMAARDKARERIAAAVRLLDRRDALLAELPRDQHALRKELSKEAPLDRRRAIIGAVIDSIVIHATKPSPRFDRDRVEIIWRA